ncbi:MAG: hypothetical protein FJ191_00580 [Gammaproteobacteria bacterium]|nr:hypothetical protein [Gammaproteobacteria bacterium]
MANSADPAAPARAAIGHTVWPARVAREPVNQPMINAWCDAIGETNPRYRAGFAPAAMLPVWTMRKFTPDPARVEGMAILQPFDAAGYVGVAATNLEQEYLRELRLGERVTEEATLEAVSDEKKTALGSGFFLTILHEFRVDSGEVVGRMRFRILKFRAREMAATARPAVAAAPPGRLRPPVNRDNAFFWEGIAAGRLLVQRCTGCGTLRHPPGPMCPQCQSLEWDTVQSSGRGTLYSFVVAHHPPIPPFEYPLPILLVDMEEGWRLVANAFQIERPALEIGMPLAVEIVEVEPGFRLPFFVRAAGG